MIRKYGFPLILGHDLAGVVTKVGSHVNRFNVGDEVNSRPNSARIGTFADFIAVDQNAIALKPKSVSFSEAASIPLIGLTVWQAMVEVGHVKAADRVLIHAGSGGIGTFAVQLAKHLGAIVATTSAANAELVAKLGADQIIDYRKVNFIHLLEPQDFILDTLGGTALYNSFKVIKKGGKKKKRHSEMPGR